MCHSSYLIYGCEFWGCSISRESWRKIEQIQKNFITYNLKIKGNTPYPILLIEVSLSPIERKTMIRYLMYKNKINNMDDKRLPKISSDSSQNHLWLKQGCHNDVKSWLNHWGKNKIYLYKIPMILKIMYKLNLRRIYGAIKN